MKAGYVARHASRLGILALCLVGTGTIRGADSPPADITVMDRMIVEATQADNHPGVVGLFAPHNAWLYVEAPDYEVLSRCDSEQTLAATRHLSDSLVLDEDYVPPRHLARLATPMTFIMFDHPPSKAMEALIPNTLDITDVSDFGIYHNPVGFTAGGIDISDADTHCAVQNRWGMPWAYAGGGLGRGPIPTGLIFKISQCIPALPAWYQYGFVGPSGLLRMTGGSDSMILAAANWISEEETKAMVAGAEKTGALPKLPPVEGLFRRREQGASLADWPSPEWMAEAALFLRWGLFGEPAHRRTFEAFIERSRSEPVTEAMFRDSFGFGFAEMQARLSRFLVEGVRNPVLVRYDAFAHWRPSTDPRHPPFPDLACREATPAEVSRILGDWERMEGNAKRVSDPALSGLYLKRAGKTLRRCYDDGERDPRFLAVLGLYDADVGAFADAQGPLVAATAAGVARPEAYVALARVLYEDALAHPGLKSGKFSDDQVAGVLKPLFEIRKKSRLDADGYVLIAEAWLHSSAKPSLSNLVVLGEGMGLYPFDSSLIYAAASVYGYWGYAAEAGDVISLRSGFADAATGKRLVDLRTSFMR